MKRIKKAASLLLAIVMIVCLVPVKATTANNPVPDPLPNEDAVIKFDEAVSVGNGVYMLVFSAKTPGNIRLLDLVFSFDASIIKAVSADGSDPGLVFGTFTDLSCNSTAYKAAQLNGLKPFVAVPVGFQLATLGWQKTLDESRQAFNATVFSTDYELSGGDYIPMLEFYFKFQANKSVSDIVAGTFRFETVGSDFVNKFYEFNQSNSIGALLKDVDIANDNECTNYYYDDSEDNVLAVYNPYALGYTVTGTVKSYNPNNATLIELYDGGSVVSNKWVGGTVVASGSIAAISSAGQQSQGFAVTGVPAGTYNLVIKKDVHTLYIVTDVVVDDDINFASAMALVVGDIDGDGQVVGQDLGIIQSTNNYLKSTTGPNAALNVRADLDGDGQVTPQDLGFLQSSKNYMKGAVIVAY